MGNTWIVDLRHYLTPAGAMADMPNRARLLAEYFASIVVDATHNLDDPPVIGLPIIPSCGRRKIPTHRGNAHEGKGAMDGRTGAC